MKTPALIFGAVALGLLFLVTIRGCAPGIERDIQSGSRAALDDALESRRQDEVGEDDVVAVLRELGAPEAVARSYEGDRCLIGPGLYPQFKTTLRVVITVLAGLVVVGTAISFFGATPGLAQVADRLADLVSGLVDSAITSIGSSSSGASGWGGESWASRSACRLPAVDGAVGRTRFACNPTASLSGFTGVPGA